MALSASNYGSFRRKLWHFPVESIVECKRNYYN